MLRLSLPFLQIAKTPSLKHLSSSVHAMSTSSRSTSSADVPTVTASSAVLAAVEELIASGGIEEALRQLNELKAMRVSPCSSMMGTNNIVESSSSFVPPSSDTPSATITSTNTSTTTATTSARRRSGAYNRSRRIKVQYDDGLDYLRALCFLRLKDPLHARQALLEEIRCNPFNEDARDLLQRIDSSLKKHFELPAAIVEAEPLFAMVYQGLQGCSMLHWPRLYSLYAHAVQMCEEGVAGDFVECGVAGGGSAVLLAVVARHYHEKSPHLPKRRVLACDTFSGMPPPTTADTIENGAVPAQQTYWGSGTCSASCQWVENLASTYHVEVEVVPGLFQHTLPRLYPSNTNNNNNNTSALNQQQQQKAHAGSTTPSSNKNNNKIALLHIDSDWYESTKCCLEHLYPHLSQHGVMQIDDFHYWDGCKQAVREFFVRQKLSLHSLQDIDNNAVWFRKP